MRREFGVNRRRTIRTFHVKWRLTFFTLQMATHFNTLLSTGDFIGFPPQLMASLQFSLPFLSIGDINRKTTHRLPCN